MIYKLILASCEHWLSAVLLPDRLLSLKYCCLAPFFASPPHQCPSDLLHLCPSCIIISILSIQFYTSCLSCSCWFLLWSIVSMPLLLVAVLLASLSVPLLVALLLGHHRHKVLLV